MKLLEVSDFAPHLNEIFRVHVGSAGPIEARLVEVTELGAKAGGGPRGLKREPFSLVFRCARDAALPQGIYTIDHEAVGRLEIFLVPIGPDEEGPCYEAVFN